MLLALIMDGGLALEVNIVKFVTKARAYESSIKMTVHYLEHNQNCALGCGAITLLERSHDFPRV